MFGSLAIPTPVTLPPFGQSLLKLSLSRNETDMIAHLNAVANMIEIKILLRNDICRRDTQNSGSPI